MPSTPAATSNRVFRNTPSRKERHPFSTAATGRKRPPSREQGASGLLAVVLLSLLCFSTTACSRQATVQGVSSRPGRHYAHERLHSALWMQTSAEYELLCRNAYAQARRSLDRALADPAWTACLEQTGDCSKLPPAVILDLDETVLDNSPFQGRLVKEGIDYNRETWKRWSDLACAKAVPGAVEFLKYAVAKGVTPVFISNRRGDEAFATRLNLHKLGIPVKNGDCLLLKYADGHPDWTSDKSSRRAYAARRYRILLMVGDDLNDFVSSRGLTVERRSELAKKYAHLLGLQWILLPNPLYGSWESAVLGGKYVKDKKEALRLKMKQIRSFD